TFVVTMSTAAVNATAPIPIRRVLFLAGVPSIARRAGTGRTQEHLAAVSERDVAPVGATGAVLGFVAIDDQFGALRQRGLRQSTPEQRVRRSTLDHPSLGGPVGLLHVEMDTGVRGDPLDLSHGALQLHGLVGIEFSSE